VFNVLAHLQLQTGFRFAITEEFSAGSPEKVAK
jgi:hypothetical protein